MTNSVNVSATCSMNFVTQQISNETNRTWFSNEQRSRSYKQYTTV